MYNFISKIGIAMCMVNFGDLCDGFVPMG